MRAQLEERLERLRDEYRQGESMLADLQKQELNLRETMLRISGAVQVLEEELRDAANPDDGETHTHGAAESEIVHQQ